MRKYRFSEGQKVMIRRSKSASIGAKEHAGEIVTIKSKCSFTWAYELIELDGLWAESCFKAIVAETTADKIAILQEAYPNFPWMELLKKYGNNTVDAAYKAIIEGRDRE